MKVLYKIGGINFLCVMYISRRGKEGLRIIRKRHKNFGFPIFYTQNVGRCMINTKNFI